MQKIMVLAACISTALGYGMNQEYEKGFIIGNTVVGLYKGCMYDHDFQASCSGSLMVVGRHEQEVLKGTDFVYKEIGTIEEVYRNTVYIKHKTINSGFDCYKFSHNTHNQFKCNYTDTLDDFSEDELYEKNGCIKFLQTKVIKVAEPCIVRSNLTYNCRYYVRRKPSAHMNVSLYDEFEEYKEQAEALKDLAMCYTTVLHEGLKNERRRILLPELGVKVGFLRKDVALVAVQTIVNYIKENVAGSTKTYDGIHLFVEDIAEFTLYDHLLTMCMNQK